MTISDLLDSFGDESTDPFLADPVAPPATGPDSPLYGRDASSWATGPGLESRPLEVLPLDSVFYDGDEPAPEPPKASRRVPFSLLAMPRRPTRGVQFSAVIGQDDLNDLNDLLQKHWRVIHAVTIQEADGVMIFLEFVGQTEGTPPRGAVPPSGPPPAAQAAPPAQAVERNDAPETAWVARPATEPLGPLGWHTGD